jgi:galactose mutarotase-like enzyme
MDPHPSFGAIVGRVENRITNAKFTLDGKVYTLLANEGTSSIHGKVRLHVVTPCSCPTLSAEAATNNQ